MGYQPIRQIDLKDPTLNLLNQQISFLYSQLSTGSSGTSSAWKDFSLNVSGAAGMVVSSLAVAQAKYQSVNSECLLMIDAHFTLSGSAGKSLTLTLPSVTPADKTTVGTTFSCVIIQASTTVAGTAVLQNGVLTVTRYDSSNLAVAAARVILCGAFRI